MAVTIGLRFPWGRFHATPWERAANEAAPEWPPSPWRLLRALYAVGKSRCTDLDEVMLVDVLAALASPPSYFLPEHVVAHTRHYLPDTTKRSGTDGNTDKVIDAFVVLGTDESVVVHWPDATLSDPDLEVLDRLLGQVSYFGRSESLCEAARVDLPTGPLLAPVEAGGASAARTVSVLVPAEPLDLTALVVSTGAMRSAGFVEPPGSRRVRYPLVDDVEPRPAPPRPPKRPTMAVFGATPRGGRGALPATTAALAMGELFRRAAQDRFDRRREGRQSPTFSGHDTGEGPRRDQHMHAHFLAVPTDPAGRFVDRFAVWAPEGLGPDEVAALTAVRSLRAGARSDAEGVGDIRPVDLALEALGDSEVLDARWVGPAQTWRSFTPFITNRHISDSVRRRALRAGIDPVAAFIVGEIRREAALRAWEVETVALVAPERGRWLDHRRHRAFKAERRAAAPRGFGMEVTFRAPVVGPVALGGMSHLGLGLFQVVAPTPSPV